MTSLDPLEYDRLENVAIGKTPNRIIEAFRAATFLNLGYPTQIREIGELARFIDVMHETQFENFFETYLGGLMEEEFEPVKEITRVASDMVFELSGIRAVPRASLVAALIQFRHIRYFFPDSDAVILEIGPGCGYLGALFSLFGYTYVSTDVTQAFYLYQNQLFDRVSSGRFVELATDDDAPATIGRPSPGANIHIPWWKFASPDPQSVDLDIDCIICAGVVSEMHPYAFKYLARQSHRWLSASAGGKLLYVGGPGAEGVNTFSSVLNELDLAGFDQSYPPPGMADPFYFFTPRA